MKHGLPKCKWQLQLWKRIVTMSNVWSYDHLITVKGPTFLYRNFVVFWGCSWYNSKLLLVIIILYTREWTIPFDTGCSWCDWCTFVATAVSCVTHRVGNRDEVVAPLILFWASNGRSLSAELACVQRESAWNRAPLSCLKFVSTHLWVCLACKFSSSWMRTDFSPSFCSPFMLKYQFL